MAEKEKEVVKKQEEDISKSDNAKNDISDLNNEQIENVNYNNDVNYTHPIVTDKKGFVDLTDYEKNYEDIEAHDSARQNKRQLIKKSKGFINIEDQPGKEENGENISPMFSDETEVEKYTKESKETTKKITEKHENDKIDTSIAAKKDRDDVKVVSDARANILRLVKVTRQFYTRRFH